MHSLELPGRSLEPQRSWMDLSEAAAFLGVHFTTLRRWVDAGRVPCIRTPGGRRRFDRAELAGFLTSLHEGECYTPDGEGDSTSLTSQVLPKHVGLHTEPWYERLAESDRAAMRSGGQRLMAVLMQYASRANGGEPFLQEGERLARRYGVVCRQSGLSLVETVRAFLMVRRSIKDSVYEAGALAGSPDPETWRLYDRMNAFLDVMLLETVEAYQSAELAFGGSE
jgi:excisionase family DNA binding protein